MKTVKTKKAKTTTKKPAKIKTDTKAVKIPLMDWLMSEEGNAFSREIIRYVARDTSFNKLRLLTLKEFAKDGWVHDWVLNGETDCFPYIDRNMRGDTAFDRLFSAMEENSDNEAILLTYGPDFGDSRDDYAFECLKVICNDPDYPPWN